MGETTLLKYENGRQLIYDPSSLEAAWKCLFYYKTFYLDGWRAKETKVTTQFGKLIHSCLELYDQLEAAGAEYGEVEDKVIGEALKLAPRLKGSDDTARTPETMVRAVAWYMDKYKGAQLPCAVVNGDALVERRVEVEIPSTPWRISMRVDKVAWDEDRLYVLDRKTTKKSLNNFMREIEPPTVQGHTYVWGCRKLGWPVEGMKYEVCQAMVNGCRWQRATFDIRQSHTDEFEQDLIEFVNYLDRWYNEGRPDRRNRASCNLYGGCEARYICNAPEAKRQAYLEDKYEQRVAEVPSILGNA